MIDRIPPELLLDGYPEPMRDIAQRLRGIVRRAAPEAIEAVRPGWRLIGYDLPVGRRSSFFAWVAAETKHAHLGFRYGVYMDDPDRLLSGAGVTRLARWLTFVPSDPLDEVVLTGLVREATRVAGMSPGERFARLMDREPSEA